MLRYILGLAVLAFAIDRGLKLKSIMAPYDKMVFNDKNCKLKGEMYGTEDMALGKHGVLFFGSSGDLSTCFTKGSRSAENGGMWIFNIGQAQKAEPVQLKLQDYPHDSIHTHGIYVSNRTERVFLINHLGPETTVEVFKINYNVKCLNKGWKCAEPVSLKHQKTVRSALFPRYGLNDVVEGSHENEIYVTRWKAFPLPEGGDHNPVGLLETLYTILNPLFGLLAIPWTLVYRCDLEADFCEGASRRIFVGANGITVAPNRSTYFVSDPAAKRIAVMERSVEGYLELQEYIDLPYPVDNPEWDEGELVMGTIPDVQAAMKKLEDKDVVCPGSLSVLRKEDTGKWKLNDVLMHDGSKLSQISAGSRFGKTAVLGSPYSKGILVCTV